jgi:hypothetical protein
MAEVCELCGDRISVAGKHRKACTEFRKLGMEESAVSFKVRLPQNVEDENHEKTVADQPSKIEAEIGPDEEEEEADDTPQLSESAAHNSMAKLQSRKSKRKKSMTFHRRNATKNLRSLPGRVTTNMRCRKTLSRGWRQGADGEEDVENLTWDGDDGPGAHAEVGGPMTRAPGSCAWQRGRRTVKQDGQRPRTGKGQGGSAEPVTEFVGQALQVFGVGLITLVKGLLTEADAGDAAGAVDKAGNTEGNHSVERQAGNDALHEATMSFLQGEAVTDTKSIDEPDGPQRPVEFGEDEGQPAENLAGLAAKSGGHPLGDALAS